jgi:general secretion pathway protein K
MTLLVVAVFDDIRFGLRRTHNAQAIAQAQWYALGTETLAGVQIRRLAARDGGRTTLAGGWNDRAFLFPIGDGSQPAGMIRARLSDATACFNLNSVVEGASGQWRRRELGASQYIALLEALQFSRHRAEALTDALVDWIDSDQATSVSGAEDAAYAARGGGYLTGGALLAEASELRAIAGYDRAAYARLRPHVCALPVAALSPVNVNTLGEDDLVILSMLTNNSVPERTARAILASRPPDGWRDTAAFWSHPALVRAAMPDPVLQQVRLRTRYFALQAEVDHGGAEVVMTALIEHDEADTLRLVARRWSIDE